jgi:hypothetical protein
MLERKISFCKIIRSPDGSWCPKNEHSDQVRSVATSELIFIEFDIVHIPELSLTEICGTSAS